MHFTLASDGSSNGVKYQPLPPSWKCSQTGRRSQVGFRSVAELRRGTISSHLWQREHKQPAIEGSFAALTSSSCHSVSFCRCLNRGRLDFQVPPPPPPQQTHTPEVIDSKIQVSKVTPFLCPVNSLDRASVLSSFLLSFFLFVSAVVARTFPPTFRGSEGLLPV